MESDEALFDGFGVVVHSTGSLTPEGQPRGHRLVRDVEVDDFVTRFDGVFKATPLIHFTRISVDEEALLEHEFNEKQTLSKRDR